MSFGTRLRERRIALGLNQSQLGELLGVTGNAIGNYENGVSSPKADVLFKAFDVLKCDANYLFQDDFDAAFLYGMDADDPPPAPSHEAMELAYAFDRLDAIGKRAVRELVRVELERVGD